MIPISKHFFLATHWDQVTAPCLVHLWKMSLQYLVHRPSQSFVESITSRYILIVWRRLMFKKRLRVLFWHCTGPSVSVVAEDIQAEGATRRPPSNLTTVLMSVHSLEMGIVNSMLRFARFDVGNPPQIGRYHWHDSKNKNTILQACPSSQGCLRVGE